LLDKDRKAINVIEWDGAIAHAVHEDEVERFPYDGLFFVGSVFDGETVSNPNPVSTEGFAPTIVDGEAMSVLA
jgi:hypothetical protein